VKKKKGRLISGYIYSTQNIPVMHWGSIAILCILIGEAGFAWFYVA